MSGGYSRSPKLLKGAIIQFTSALIVPIPNIIIFQYNPESLSRTLAPFVPTAATSTGAPAEGTTRPTNEASQPFDPVESFDLTLFLDATDALEEPDSHPVATVSGVADRLAALEMLLYPVDDSLLGGLLGQLSVSVGGGGLGVSASASVQVAKRPEVPVILFVFGPGRIVPVRLTQFRVEEQQYNQLLYPHRAKVTLGMRVLTDKSLDAESSDNKGKDLAKFAYKFTRAQKEALALLNIANTVESVLGMLPF